MSAEDSWTVFREILEGLEYRHIPIKKLSSKRQKPIWMTNRALKAVQRRHQAYRKYRDPKHPAYIKAAKTAKRLLKEARQKFEVKLVQNINSFAAEAEGDYSRPIVALQASRRWRLKSTRCSQCHRRLHSPYY